MSEKPFQTDEEKTIEMAKAALGHDDLKNNKLSEPLSRLLKSYKKLNKQHRFLIKRGDKQELETRRINDELMQTNELLKDTLTKGSMQVRDELIAQVMNLTGELVLTRNQLLEAFRSKNSDTRKMEGFLQNLDMVTTALQERIMQTRMQPIGNVFATLPRIVTTESQKQKKLIRLEIEGSDVKLDKSILDILSDHLARVVRNACDHGIEKPAERYQGGKPETGTISVIAFHDAGQINVMIRDDGRGIDPGIIKKKTLGQGLMPRSELSGMNAEEVLSLLLLPGISALSLMKSAVEEHGGYLEIVSEKGEGTAIYLRLPITLAIIPCLIVAVGNGRYVIPKTSVDELVCLYDKEVCRDIEYAGDQEVFRLREALIPMVRMSEVLIRPETFTKTVRSEITEKYSMLAKADLMSQGRLRKMLLFAVVKVGARRFGLIVDQITGSEEIVVTSMHSRVKALNIYSGTTIMGDGSVALILDVHGIAAHAGVEFVTDTEKSAEKLLTSDSEKTRRVLVFEIGEHERFAIPLSMIRRVQEISPDRIEQVGSKFYITVEGTSTLVLRPDNFLNISPCVMREEMYLILPRHARRPFGILISRLTDVLDAPMMLNEQSCMTDGILGTAVLQNRITLFPDIPGLLEKVAPSEYTGPTPENPEAPHPAENSVTILLVEDTAFFRHLIRNYLESADYGVKTAENGLKALELMEKEDFDLIISDIEMPEMDGWAFLRQVRNNERHRHIPAMALTRLDSREVREKAGRVGFNAYERKIDRESLLASTSRLLKGKRYEH